jgi:hypothetical protein
VIRYIPTNGPGGELVVDWDGWFAGFISRCGNEHRWCAYTTSMEMISDQCASRAQAAEACKRRHTGRRIPIAELLMAAVGR